MFHCHFTKQMRIVSSDNLTAQTLDEAIAAGRRLLRAKPDSDEIDGILIWKDLSFHRTSFGSSAGATGSAEVAP
jgi:hypothetical protein